MIVSDLMRKKVIYVHPETSVTDARALMARENVNKLPVLDRDGRLAGIEPRTIWSRHRRLRQPRSTCTS